MLLPSQKPKKRSLKKLFAPALLMLFVITQSACTRHYQFFKLRRSDKQLSRAFRKSTIKPSVHYYVHNNRSMRFVELGQDSSKPVIIFCHGSPSSLSMFDIFLKDRDLLNHAQLVSVDRPGYGFSGFGKVEPSIHKQAEHLGPLIERYTGRKIILVGSSYGGPVVARLGMLYPEAIQGLVFISASLAPGREKVYRVSHWMKRKWLGWMFPRVLRTATIEKLYHETALREIEPDWEKIRSEVVLFHGTADALIYPDNATYARNKLSAAKRVELRFVDAVGHTIVYDRPQLVKEALISMLTRSQKNETKSIYSTSD